MTRTCTLRFARPECRSIHMDGLAILWIPTLLLSVCRFGTSRDARSFSKITLGFSEIDCCGSRSSPQVRYFSLVDCLARHGERGRSPACDCASGLGGRQAAWSAAAPAVERLAQLRYRTNRSFHVSGRALAGLSVTARCQPPATDDLEDDLPQSWSALTLALRLLCGKPATGSREVVVEGPTVLAEPHAEE